MIVKSLKESDKIKFGDPYICNEALLLAQKGPEYIDESLVIENKYATVISKNIYSLKNKKSSLKK